MLCVQNEQCLQDLHNLLVLCHLTLGAESHSKEVVHIAQVHIWLHYRLSLEDSETRRRDSRHLAQDSVDVRVSLVLRLVAKLTSEESRVGLWMTR